MQVIKIMRLTITGRKIKVTPSLETYVSAKLVRILEKFLADKKRLDASALDIELGRTSVHHRKGVVWRADAALELPGRKNPIFARVEAVDLHAAIDTLAEEVGREVKKYKEKTVSLALRGARRIKRDVRLDPAARMYRRGRILNEGN